MPTLLITGANRGLGLEFAKQYAADGWHVIATCRNPDQADALKSIANIRIEKLDVGDDASLDALAEKLKGSAIDLLINNAGIYSGTNGDLGNDASQNLGSIDSEGWMKVLRINTIAPIKTIEALLPLLQGPDKKIVNITSRMGSLAEMGTGSIAYRSSKTALNAAMRVIAHDMQHKGITIVNMHPGWIQTDMGGARANLTPEQSVSTMRQTIARLTMAQTGQFLNYDGQKIEW